MSNINISKDISKLSRNTQRLIKAFSLENRKPILKEAATIFEKSAKNKAPSKTGKLKDSISVQEGKAVVFVGPAAAYGRHVEYGTQYNNARPFMRPAFVSGRDAVAKKIEKGFKELLKKYKARL